MPRPTRVALALGAGGARGYAHIGVIEVLEERGYEIVCIAGTSMGALVGGLHAAGRLEAYTEWVRGLTASQIIRLLDPSLRAPGVLRAEKVVAKVAELLSGATIESLPIPFTAVATDLLAGKEVWLQRGPLDAAIRASIAIPSVITPVVLNGRLLADGGLMNPIPTAATTATAADVTVAVSLVGATAQFEGRTPDRESTEPRPSEEWRDRFLRAASPVLEHDTVRGLIDRTGIITGAIGESTPNAAVDDLAAVESSTASLVPDPSEVGIREVIDLSIEAMQNLVTRYCLAAYPADLVITVPKTACRTFDFHKANEMITIGRNTAIEAIDGDPTFPPARTDGR